VSGGALETVLNAQIPQRKQTSIGPPQGEKTAPQVDIGICDTWYMGGSLREVRHFVKSIQPSSSVVAGRVIPVRRYATNRIAFLGRDCGSGLLRGCRTALEFVRA
jgi:hypothetical protein